MTNLTKLKENTIAKVSSDGEPHEILTLVAVLSGVLAAIILLMMFGYMINCRKKPNPSKTRAHKFTIFSQRKSFDIKEIQKTNEPIKTISVSIHNECETTRAHEKENQQTITSTLPGFTSIAC